MSTPNPTHIDVIARALANTADDGCFDNPPNFDDLDNPPSFAEFDEWHSGEEDREHWTKLARASVSKLTDAGYSIVPTEQTAAKIYDHAADVIHAEARWQWELDARRSVGAQIVAQRMQVMEKVLRNFATAAAEGEKP